MEIDNGLITKPIPGLIAQLAIPASIGMFFNTMFNVVDTYFSGLISTEAIAALVLIISGVFCHLGRWFRHQHRHNGTDSQCPGRRR